MTLSDDGSVGNELKQSATWQSPISLPRGVRSYTLSPWFNWWIDANAFVAGLRSAGSASRGGLRRALAGNRQPLFCNAVWKEYCDLLGCDVWGHTTTAQERQQMLTGGAAGSVTHHVRDLGRGN